MRCRWWRLGRFGHKKSPDRNGRGSFRGLRETRNTQSSRAWSNTTAWRVLFATAMGVKSYGSHLSEFRTYSARLTAAGPSIGRLLPALLAARSRPVANCRACEHRGRCTGRDRIAPTGDADGIHPSRHCPAPARSSLPLFCGTRPSVCRWPPRTTARVGNGGAVRASMPHAVLAEEPFMVRARSHTFAAHLMPFFA